MYIDRWNEICFLLSDNIQQETSEDLFEKQVIQALRVLDWKQYLDDFDIRPSFKIGASNKITPDFVVKSKTHGYQFVIEIKQPNIPLNSGFQRQLFSYMRILKLEYGILIGKEIQIFYDGEKIKQADPLLLETIKFERDSKRGEEFAKLFSKDNFTKESLEKYVQKIIAKINREEDFKLLTSKLLSSTFIEKLSNLIKQELIGEYDGELIDAVLEKVNINISEKFKSTQEYPQEKLIQDNQILNTHILKSHNKSFKEFSRYLANKYIEDETQKQIFLKDGVWMKVQLNYIAAKILDSRDRKIFSPKEIRDVIRTELIPSLAEIDDNQLSGLILTSDVHTKAATPQWHNGYPCLENIGRGQYRFIGFPEEFGNRRTNPKQIIKGRDFSKYIIYIDGLEENNLNKRKAIFLVISTAIRKGIKPEELFSITTKSRWIWVEKVCNTRKEFEEQKIQNRSTYDANRWFVEDNELFIVGERTYAFSNQHSTEAFTIISNVFKKFPELNGSIEVCQ